jgi:ribosome-associated protein
MLKVSKHIRIDEQELEETFIRASGPGGQKVNKTATAVQLRFDVLNSTSLPEEVRERLGKLAGSRLTQDGVLVIEAKEHRTQERNRDAARQRLVDLIRRAVRKPKTRKKTKPTKTSQKRRLEQKRRRGELKRQRRSIPPPETG